MISTEALVDKVVNEVLRQLKSEGMTEKRI